MEAADRTSSGHPGIAPASRQGLRLSIHRAASSLVTVIRFPPAHASPALPMTRLGSSWFSRKIGHASRVSRYPRNGQIAICQSAFPNFTRSTGLDPGWWVARVESSRGATWIRARHIGVQLAWVLELVVEARPVRALERFEVRSVTDYRSVTSDAYRIG